MGKKTQRISTPRFGEIAFTRDDVYTFPGGLVGLRDMKRFVMIELDESGLFRCLQSIDDTAYAFILTDPLLVKPDYRIKVDEGTISTLGLEDLSEAVALVTVVVPSDGSGMTANLRGPVLVNVKKRLGVQIVLPQSEYGVRVSLSDALNQQEEELPA